tara:strand:+ start:4107 stop:4469 length:363 start_codon:yes stop_codon:yes gene_type:complete
MKILLLSGLLYSTAYAGIVSSVVAQENPEPKMYWAQKPVQCSTLAELVSMLSKYGETPYMRMEGFVGMPNANPLPSQFVIAYNAETTTWTIVEYTNNSQACVLGSGTGKISFPNSSRQNI